MTSGGKKLDIHGAKYKRSIQKVIWKTVNMIMMILKIETLKKTPMTPIIMKLRKVTIFSLEVSLTKF